ncbi:hypothetical protein AWB70_07584 [Caballeronia cordobensis]|uniref:Uncharacterized protein n=1 Tax=Caballeronia cordobensis TaxID=1353886 RepID=A0A158JWL2_CABCO|nr:hypothetical protein AWB70_07584 [Caballeronia cordobensis]
MTQDDLCGCTEAIVNERGAQNVVPLDDLLQGIEPGIETRAAIESDARGLQIRIAFGGQHVMEQNAFLKRRKRVDILHVTDAAGHVRDDAIDIGLRQCDERQHGRGERGGIGRDGIGRHDDIGGDRAVFERSGKRAEHRRGEEIAHVGVQADAAHALDKRHSKQRVSAEGEEVVLPADAFEAEQLGPQLGERGFGFALRRFEGAQREGIGLRVGQRVTIELAIGREGQCIERDEG